MFYLQSSRLVMYFLVRMVTDPSTMVPATSLQDHCLKHKYTQVLLRNAFLRPKGIMKKLSELKTCPALV